jgi:hypothetical protein
LSSLLQAARRCPSALTLAAGPEQGVPNKAKQQSKFGSQILGYLGHSPLKIDFFNTHRPLPHNPAPSLLFV